MKKNSRGMYQTSVSLGKDPVTGKTRQAWVYARTVSELREKVARKKEEIASGNYQQILRRRKLKGYAHYWWETYKMDPLSKVQSKNVQSYLSTISHFDELGEMNLRDIRKEHVVALISGRSYEQQRRIRMTLSQIFEQAIEDGLMQSNPCKNLKIVQKPDSEQRRFTDSERKEILRLIETLPEEERVLVALLFYTGLRRGEVLALKWEDVRYGYVNVTKSVKYPSNLAVVGRPKTKTSVRKVEVVDELHNILSNSCGAGYIFQRADGNPLSLHNFRDMWTHIQKQAMVEDIDGFTPHRFRHDFCSRLYEAGVSAVDAQKIMGHSSISVTIGIYTHFAEDVPVSFKKKLKNI